MITIVFWGPTGEIGGAENSLLVLLKGLDRKVFSPLVVCGTNGPLVEKLRKLKFPYEVVEFPKKFIRLSRDSKLSTLGIIYGLKSILKITRLLTQENAYLLYTNGIKCHILGCAAAKFARVKLVWHFRDIMQQGKIRGIIRLLARLFPNRIIAASQSTANQFVWPHAMSQKVDVVYNGVDLSVFYPDPISKKKTEDFDFRDYEHIVGIFGMLVPLKGHRYFIEAAKLVLRTFSKTLFLIVGDEIYNTANRSHKYYGELLKKIVLTKQLQDAVIFTGYKSNVPELMRCCDVIVLSSIHPEACPRTVLEAMACGKPIVGTALGGTNELIEDGLSGKLVEPCSGKSLADGILSLLKDSRKRQEVGLYARKRTKNYFSAERHCKEIQNILLSLLEKS